MGTCESLKWNLIKFFSILSPFIVVLDRKKKRKFNFFDFSFIWSLHVIRLCISFEGRASKRAEKSFKNSNETLIFFGFFFLFYFLAPFTFFLLPLVFYFVFASTCTVEVKYDFCMSFMEICRRRLNFFCLYPPFAIILREDKFWFKVIFKCRLKEWRYSSRICIWFFWNFFPNLFPNFLFFG